MLQLHTIVFAIGGLGVLGTPAVPGPRTGDEKQDVQRTRDQALRVLEHGSREERFAAFRILSKDPTIPQALVTQAVYRRMRACEERVLLSGELGRAAELRTRYCELLRTRSELRRACADYLEGRSPKTSLAVREWSRQLDASWTSSTSFALSKDVATDVSDIQWCALTLERQPDPGAELAKRVSIPAWALYSSSFTGTVTIRDYCETGAESRATWRLGAIGADPWGAGPDGAVMDQSDGNPLEFDWFMALDRFRLEIGNAPLPWNRELKLLLEKRASRWIKGVQDPVAGERAEAERTTQLNGHLSHIAPGARARSLLLVVEAGGDLKAQILANVDLMATIVSHGEGGMALKIQDGYLVCVVFTDE
jgi:hypothetical protein